MNINKSLVNFYTLLELRRLLSAYPFNREKIEQVQLRKLRKILICAYNDFDFYRDRMDSCGLDPYKISEPGEIQKIPVLTEAEYRDFADYEYEKNPSKYKSWFFDSTSGTTGIPFRIVRTWPERAYMTAKFLRTLFLNGLSWNDHTFRIIAPTRIPERKDTLLQHLGLFRRSLMNFYSTPAEMALAYQEYQPDFFYANKHQILMTAQYLLEFGLPFKKPKIYSAGAEIIEENCRHLFYRAFGRDNFFETYGSNEIGNLGFQIKGTEGLHFCHDTSILELQDADGSITKDEGNCLITDLGISSFPLIRFQLGDYLKTFEDERGIRKIRNIWGRLHDWLAWDDGSRTGFSEFFKIMGRFSSEICQFQIVQENFHFVRIRAVPAPGKTSAPLLEQKISQKIIAAFQTGIRSGIEYQVDFVPLIPAGKNGKVKMVLSKIEK